MATRGRRRIAQVRFGREQRAHYELVHRKSKSSERNRRANHLRNYLVLGFGIEITRRHGARAAGWTAALGAVDHAAAFHGRPLGDLVRPAQDVVVLLNLQEFTRSVELALCQPAYQGQTAISAMV